jgi:signal transduction histidine kinase
MFIWSQTRRFPERDPHQRFQVVAGAAERAIDESRRAIAALTMPIDQPLDEVISRTAYEIAGRLGVTIKTDLDEGVQASPEIREGLLRIVREAVTNASRHGGAELITVRLSCKDGLCLRVVDDGLGFDVSQARRNARGFGLISMEERAREMGGTFRISSEPGTGTEIEVQLPSTSRFAS